MIVLIVEDDAKIARFLRKGLLDEGYSAEITYTGEEALEKTGINEYDFIVMDIMLPGIDGIEVTKKIREDKINTPILLLTAKNSVHDRVRGLDAGADDYLTKPFSVEELLARARALLRRERTVKPTRFKVADLTLDPSTHEVRRGQREIHLTSKEYRLLNYMIRRPGRVCTRTMIAEHIWGYNFSPNSNVIDVSVGTMRRKIDKGFAQKLIHTVRDVGYKLQDKRVSPLLSP
jgi:DNA-binding response OmpR family regulator